LFHFELISFFLNKSQTLTHKDSQSTVDNVTCRYGHWKMPTNNAQSVWKTQTWKSGVIQTVKISCAVGVVQPDLILPICACLKI